MIPKVYTYYDDNLKWKNFLVLIRVNDKEIVFDFEYRVNKLTTYDLNTSRTFFYYAKTLKDYPHEMWYRFIDALFKIGFEI